MSSAAPSIDLRPDHWAIVRGILRRYVPDRKVLAFGSRATWTAKDYSDLDVAIMGDEPLSPSATSTLAEGFGESDLPFKVDIVDWAKIDKTFRDIIRRDGVAVQVPAEAAKAIGPAHPSLPTSRSLGMTDSGWSRVPLGDFVTLQRGHDLPVAVRRPGNTPILGSFGVTGWHDEPRASGPGVTVGRSGASFGVVSYSPVDYWPLNTALYVIDFHGNDQRFAYYFLKHFDFRSYNSGSAQPSLNRNFIHPIPVDVPPVCEQRAIAHILGTLDDKIELNRRMNETLEASAQALFKSWFVDFDPVRAKMEGRHTGLPQDIADLFPDRLVNSEMGEIPEGWEVFRLDQLANHHTKTTSPSRFSGLEHEHFSIPAYDAGQRPAIELGAAIRSNKTVVLKDAVLLSKLNPRIARVWVPADFTARPQICSTEFLVFTPRSPANRSLLFTLFGDQRFRALLKSLVTGTSNSHQRVPPKALKAREVLTGSPRAFTTFGEVIGGTLARVLKNRSEVATLAALRDTLLPKLISGEIRVPDAEMALESVI